MVLKCTLVRRRGIEFCSTQYQQRTAAGIHCQGKFNADLLRRLLIKLELRVLDWIGLFAAACATHGQDVLNRTIGQRGNPAGQIHPGAGAPGDHAGHVGYSYAKGVGSTAHI